MAKKKTAGITKVGSRDYRIDAVAVICGKRVHFRGSGYQTAEEAKFALAKMKAERQKELSLDSSEKPFEDFEGEYWQYRLTSIKPQTAECLRSSFKKHFGRCAKGKTLKEALSLPFVRERYLELINRQDLRSEAKNIVIEVLRSMAERAWRWRHIGATQYEDLLDLLRKAPKDLGPKREKAIWSPVQVQAFLDAIPDNTVDKVMFTLLAYLGCRKGELFGLQWNCIDEQARTISIHQQVLSSTGRLSSSLKTGASYRVDLLDGPTFDLLMRYKTAQKPQPTDFLFGKNGNPISAKVLGYKMRKYAKLAGLPEMNPHGLRHCKATLLASVCHNAEEIAVGAAFLGHSPAMFMSTYVNQKGISQQDLLSRITTSKMVN